LTANRIYALIAELRRDFKAMEESGASEGFQSDGGKRRRVKLLSEEGERRRVPKCAGLEEAFVRSGERARVGICGIDVEFAGGLPV
jgi:hypothetical protein